jgi:hypothetical protein
MDWIRHIQWPAMVVTVTATWLVASSNDRRRNLAFWVYLTGNALWLAWGLHDRAWALVVLQVALAVMNIRGAKKTDPSAGADAGAGESAGASG